MPFPHGCRYIEHSRVTSQVVSKFVKCLQGFFSFLNKSLVAIEAVEEYRVIDVLDADARQLQLLAHENILIAIAAEARVERMGEILASCHQKVRRVEVLIGSSLAALQRETRLGSLLVAIAQIIIQSFIILQPVTTAHHIGLRFQISLQELIVADAHPTINEQQPVVGGYRGQEVTDGSSAHILLPNDVSAMGQEVDSLVGSHRFGIG